MWLQRRAHCDDVGGFGLWDTPEQQKRLRNTYNTVRNLGNGPLLMPLPLGKSVPPSHDIEFHDKIWHMKLAVTSKFGCPTQACAPRPKKLRMIKDIINKMAANNFKTELGTARTLLGKLMHYRELSDNGSPTLRAYRQLVNTATVVVS